MLSAAAPAVLPGRFSTAARHLHIVVLTATSRASFALTTSQGIAQNCPDAWVNIISNPVNSTVPIAAEVLKKAGKFNPKRVFGAPTRPKQLAGQTSPPSALQLTAPDFHQTSQFPAQKTLRRCLTWRPRLGSRPAGVTHLDVMRARAFVAGAMGVDTDGVDVPVGADPASRVEGLHV